MPKMSFIGRNEPPTHRQIDRNSVFSNMIPQFQHHITLTTGKVAMKMEAPLLKHCQNSSLCSGMGAFRQQWFKSLLVHCAGCCKDRKRGSDGLGQCAAAGAKHHQNEP